MNILGELLKYVPLASLFVLVLLVVGLRTISSQIDGLGSLLEAIRDKHDENFSEEIESRLGDIESNLSWMQDMMGRRAGQGEELDLVEDSVFQRLCSIDETLSRLSEKLHKRTG